MIKPFLTKTLSALFALLLIISVSIPTTLAVGPPTITVGSVEGKTGDTISVPVTITNNPGIVAIRIFVEYNTEVLQLTGVQDGTVFPTGKNTFNGSLQAMPYTMLWADGTARTNYTGNGTLATLIFTISESAKESISPITVTYDSKSTFDVNLQEALNEKVNANKRRKNGGLGCN